MTPYWVIMKLDLIWHMMHEILKRFPIPIETDSVELDRPQAMIGIRQLVEDQRGILPESIFRWVWRATLDYQTAVHMCEEAETQIRACGPDWRWRVQAALTIIRSLIVTLKHVENLMDKMDDLRQGPR